METICWVMALAAGLFAADQPLASAASPAEPKAQVLWNKLEATVVREADELDGVLGVAIHDLTSGQEWFLHPDEVFPQASSIKITVLAELYRQAQEGKPGQAKLSDLYTPRAEDLVADSDVLLGLTPGVSRVTNRDLATFMVTVSDNSATNILIDRVGMANVNALLDRLDLKQTRLRRKMMDLPAARAGRENVSTPREMMQLLRLLHEGKVLNKPMTEDFFKVLSMHKESALLRGLPDRVRAASKPGALEGVRTDSGIIFARNRPFILCVMGTYLRDEKAGEAAIERITTAAYQMFDRLGRASRFGRVISPFNSGGAGPD